MGGQTGGSHVLLREWKSTANIASGTGLLLIFCVSSSTSYSQKSASQSGLRHFIPSARAYSRSNP